LVEELALFTAEQVAERLGCEVQTVNEKAAAHQLPAVKYGRGASRSRRWTSTWPNRPWSLCASGVATPRSSRRFRPLQVSKAGYISTAVNGLPWPYW